MPESATETVPATVEEDAGIDVNEIFAVLQEVYDDALEGHLFHGPTLLFDLDQVELFGEFNGENFSSRGKPETLLTTEFIWVLAEILATRSWDCEIEIFVAGVRGA